MRQKCRQCGARFHVSAVTTPPDGEREPRTDACAPSGPLIAEPCDPASGSSVSAVAYEMSRHIPERARRIAALGLLAQWNVLVPATLIAIAPVTNPWLFLIGLAALVAVPAFVTPWCASRLRKILEHHHLQETGEPLPAAAAPEGRDSRDNALVSDAYAAQCGLNDHWYTHRERARIEGVSSPLKKS